MHKAVENGACHRLIGDHLVSVFDVDLTGHNGAVIAISVLEDLR